MPNMRRLQFANGAKKKKSREEWQQIEQEGKSKMAGNWNYESCEYNPYELPLGSATIAPLNAPIACAACGKPVRYRDTFTSLEIHNFAGFGYAVCEDCYKEEWKRREAYEKSN